MSREIKFRAWDKKNGYYADYEDIEEEVTAQAIDGWRSEDGGTSFTLDYGVKDFVVEQYTGLKDKDGKEIYEGDIVKVYSRRKLLDGFYQVIWNEEAGGFECECLKPLVEDYDNIKDVRVFNEYYSKFAVIGNIHENEDLLGGEK